MKLNIFPALCLALVLPISACGSQHFKKNQVDKTQGQPTTALTDNPETAGKAAKHVTSVFDGEWIIKRVGDVNIEREEDYPYINFAANENNFYASNGCNVLNGAFTVDTANKTVTFHNVISTLRYCADTPWDTQINAALGDGVPVKYEYKMENGEARLYFLNNAGERVLSLAKPGLDFLNGNWRVDSIEGEKFEDSDMTIFFDIEERKVHGDTGCNSFNGTIYVDPQNKQSFSLQNMAVTMRMCPNIENQSKFLVALEQACTASAGQNGSVNLVNASGKTVLVLVKK